MQRPCAQGTNASDLAATALSASPAGSTPVVLLARTGAAPTTGSTPSRSCVSMLEVQVPSHPHSQPSRRSRSLGLPWRIGKLSNPTPDQSSSCRFGDFEGSGRQPSVVCCSVGTASTRDGFSRVRVSGGDGTGDKDENVADESRGADGAACSSLPTHGIRIDNDAAQAGPWISTTVVHVWLPNSGVLWGSIFFIR